VQAQLEAEQGEDSGGTDRIQQEFVTLRKEVQGKEREEEDFRCFT